MRTFLLLYPAVKCAKLTKISSPANDSTVGEACGVDGQTSYLIIVERITEQIRKR